MTPSSGSASTASPLSYAQQRMWLFNQLEPGHPLYNRPKVSRWSGPLDADALERALRGLLARHEVLRTRFPLTLDGPVQQVDDLAEFTLPARTFAGEPDLHRERRVWSWALQEATRGFDLTREIPFRAALARVGEQEHWLLLVIHHVAFDRWSRGVLYRDLLALYAGEVEGRPPVLPELTLRFRDYVAWQGTRLASADLAAELDHWTRRLGGAPPLMPLPDRRPHPPVQTFEGASVDFVIDQALGRRVAAVARELRMTPFIVLLGAFKLLLCRATGATDAVIGVPSAGRLRVELEPLVGCFTNTLVLRTDLSGDPTVREAFLRVRETVFDALDHQELPFERLVEALQPSRDPRYHPVFQVVFNHFDDRVEPTTVAGVTVEHLDFDHSAALVDLTVDCRPSGPGWQCKFTYNTALFEASAIRQLARDYVTLLHAASEHGGMRLSQLPVRAAAQSADELLQELATMSEDDAARLLAQAQAEKRDSNHV